MAKRNRSTTESVIERRIKEGRGKGVGKEYKPWLNIQDVPSTGQANRKTSWTVGREHQLLSKLELHVLFIFDWSPDVIDIREQYPLLPQRDTLVIAKEFGIDHPADPKTRENIVVTTDFVLTMDEQGQHHTRAVAVKPAAQLQDPRVIEKLEIERLYWQSANVSWCIATERELNMTVVKNIELLHDYRDIPIENFSAGEFDYVAAHLMKQLRQPVVLAKVAVDCDRTCGLAPGTSLSIAYHLLATRQVKVNMRVPIDARKPLSLMLQ